MIVKTCFIVPIIIKSEKLDFITSEYCSNLFFITMYYLLSLKQTKKRTGHPMYIVIDYCTFNIHVVINIVYDVITRLCVCVGTCVYWCLCVCVCVIIGVVCTTVCIRNVHQ